MTCIVGIAHQGRVWIGADSAGVAGHSLTRRRDEKVLVNGPFIMGFTSSFRMGQLLAHAFTPPRFHPDSDVYAFMVTDFINAIRECFKQGGYAEKHNEAERGGTFLVGFMGRLFYVDSDYQVGESVDGFDACGSGADIALGALFANTKADAAPRDRIMTALQAAATYNTCVCDPFHVLFGGQVRQGGDA
ncbi:MAG: hypothetical protein ABGX47_23875 [Martelella sp.]|uniref:hypothetical protein n=1 Tax=Martelella sp. TaxID=1969699 RepID=UPI003242D738